MNISPKSKFSLRKKKIATDYLINQKVI